MAIKGIVCEHCGRFLDFSNGLEGTVAVVCLYCREVVQVGYERMEELLLVKDLLYYLTVRDLASYYDGDRWAGSKRGEGSFDALTPEQQRLIAYEVDRALGYSLGEDLDMAFESGINSAIEEIEVAK